MTAPLSHQPSLTQPYEQTRQLLERLCEGLYDRDEPVRLALLSALAGESLFLLGPPGVGKSLIARRLKHAFASGRAFEYLMTRFSTPDEIFGPVSIRKLREEDRYERRTEGYLPGSDLIFLDEIWKAGPAIQNALLTVLNERVYRNGEQDIPVAVRAVLTASNELPSEGESLSPLWDRFLLRYAIEGVRGWGAFLSMITDTRDVYQDQVEPELKLTTEQLDAWSEAIDQVALPPEVLNVLQVVRHRLEQANQSGAMPRGPLLVSDRRWKKIVRLLRTSAFLHDREGAHLMDCFLLPHALWSHPDQQQLLRELVHDAVHRHGYSLVTGLSTLQQEVDELDREILEETEVLHLRSEEQPLLVEAEYHRLLLSDSRLKASRIVAKEYARLDAESALVIKVMDEESVLRHRLPAKLGVAPHSVRIEIQGQWIDLRLETQLVERQERIRRRPHRLLVEHWGRRIDRLEEEVERQRSRLEEERPPELCEDRPHLFVDAALGRVVGANHERVLQGFQRLRLQLEKSRFRMLRDGPS